MPQPSLPPEVQATLEAIHRDVLRAHEQIIAEQRALLRQWPNDRKPVRLRRLDEMQANVADLTVRLERTLSGKVPVATTTAFEVGAWGTALQVGAEATFAAADIEAAARIARDTMDDVLTATRGVRESSKDVVRTMSRDRLVNQTYAGLTAEQQGIRLAADLAGAGLDDVNLISGVTYGNGARVALPSYTDMLMRTKSAVAMQEGGFRQGKELGIEWWEIMDGPDCGLSFHDDPTLADGMIVPTEQAERFPISHPNCVRVTSPRPDIESARMAKAATRTSPEAQVADQAAASRARAEFVARNPRRYGLERQVNRELSLRGDYGAAATTPTSLAVARQTKRVAPQPPSLLDDILALPPSKTPPPPPDPVALAADATMKAEAARLAQQRRLRRAQGVADPDNADRGYVPSTKASLDEFDSEKFAGKNGGGGWTDNGGGGQDGLIVEMWEQNGFAGRPTVLADDAFEAAVAASPEGRLYRGFGYTNDPDGLSPAQMIDEFRDGYPPYGGLGLAGNGTYVARDFQTSRLFAKNDNRRLSGEVIDMTISPAARGIDLEDLKEMHREALAAVDRYDPVRGALPQEYLAISDVGRFATIQGYDYIRNSGFWSWDEVIILNRTAVIMRADPDARAVAPE